MATEIREALSERERTKLNDLETIIERGLQTFVEVGAALSMVREQRLYRETHETFDAYCEARWNWTKRRANQLIEAHGVVASLAEAGTILPENVEQARALKDVPPEHRATVLEEAREAAATEGKRVTAERIRDTAHKYTPLSQRKSKPTKKPKHEKPEDMAAAIAKAAEERAAKAKTIPGVVPEDHTSAANARGTSDGGGSTPPAGEEHEGESVSESEGTPTRESRAMDAEPTPLTSPEPGRVVVFVRTIALPEPDDVAGMTDEDLAAVRSVQAWCGRVIAAHARRTIRVV